MKKTVTYYAKRILSLLMALCVLLLPTTAFGEPAAPAQQPGTLKITSHHSAEALTANGKLYIKQGDAAAFTEVSFTDGEFTLVNMEEVTSLTVKIEPNSGYKLDEGRGVSLRKNTEDPQTVNGEGLNKSVVDGVTSYTASFTLSEVDTSTFELEFSFMETPRRELSIGCHSNIDVGGAFKYKFDGDTGFTTGVINTNPEDSSKYYEPIDLGDNTAITIKIEPKPEYRLEDVRLREDGGNGNAATEEQLTALLSEDGLRYDLSSEVTNFSFEFAFRSKLEGGNRPYLGEYDGGTYVENISFTVNGDISFCINDSLFYSDEDIKASTDGLKADYHYSGDTVDFYVECHINRKYTKLKINGNDYLCQIPTSADGLLAAIQGQLYRFKITVTRADSYTIESATDEVSGEEMVVGNFSWWYDSTRTDNDDDVISNGTMQLIGIEFNGAPFVETEFLCWEENEDGSGGSAVLPAGAKVTVKIIPEYGYQLTSFELNGNPFETGEEQSVFTFTVGNGNFHLGAKITKVDDVVVANSQAVSGGEIKIGEGEINTGSVQLTVEDNTNASLKTEFEGKLDPGFEVNSVLNIDLKQVLYKGSMDEFWETDMHNLEKGAAQISFELADAFQNVVVLHKKGDGSIDKIIPTYENGRITFETSSFSPFALAVVESADPKYQIGFDPRGEEDCVTVKIGSGAATPAVPWANRTYTSGDSTFTITINVPEDRKEFKPLVSVERMVGESEPMDAFEPTLSGRNGVYSFSFVPNQKFSVQNAEFVVIINWSEYDAIWASDEQFCIKTVNVYPELGDIEILTAGIKSVSLGDETKTLYNRQDTTFTVNIKFTPKPGRVRLSRLFVGDQELSADNGQITPLGADGSFTYTVTVPAKNAAVDSNLDIAAEFDENVEVASITVQTSPAVTTYSIGEDIDVAGGQIKVTYDNGWSEVIDMEPEMIRSFDSSTSGSKTVTVSFEGKTSTFTVEVVETARVDSPVISPNGGTFTSSQTVTITCATDGAKIFYSIDGIEYAEYTAPFTISASTIVSAYATKDDLLDSFTASAEFTKKASSSSTGGSSSGGNSSSKPTNTDSPQISGDNGKKGWDVIADEIKDTKKGDSITIEMNGAKLLPGRVLDEIVGKDINLVLDMGNGFVWTINGKSVTNTAGVDMGVSFGSNIPVTVINALTGEKEYKTITLEHEGNFGFTAVLTVKMGSKNKGYFANLYYFNEGKRNMEFISSGKIRTDGNADLTFTHASEYVIVIDATDHGTAGGTGNDTSKPDTDNSNSGNGSNNNSGNSSNDNSGNSSNNNSGNGSNNNSGTGSGDNSGSGATNPPTGVVVGYGMLFVSGTAALVARKKRNKK